MGRPPGSAARVEPIGSAQPPGYPTARGALNLLKSPSWVQLVPSTARACSYQSEASWEGVVPFLANVHLGPPDWGRSGLALGPVTFASFLHRRPIPRCLREGGEVTALGLPDSRVYEGIKSGVPGGSGRGGRGRAADLWSSKGQRLCKPKA